MTSQTMALPSTAKARRWTVLIVLAVLLAIAAVFIWHNVFRKYPQKLADGSGAERFKYGTIGAEDEAGIPYWLWLVLPKMFPEYLPRPGGWAALGLSWEPGRELPVGISKRRIGFDRVAINCAFCHSARVRKPGDVTPRIYPGAPGTTIDPLAYQRFLFACASDPRFTATNVLKELDGITQLGVIERSLYRVLVPATRKALLEQRDGFEWTKSRVDWGRGRIDPFNPIKFGILKELQFGDAPISKVDDGTIGNSDMEPIWNMGPRVARKMAFHWDGLNDDLTEVVLSSAIGDGGASKNLPLPELSRIQEWIKALSAPRYEELFPLDAHTKQLAQRGEPIFKRWCADCHAFDGSRTGKLIPLTDEAWSEGVAPDAPRPRYVDDHRAKMWTKGAANAYNAYADDYPWAFSHFRSTGQAVNVPLDGLWLRAPYLHNGSVPYLAELLEDPSKRTKVFYRGLDVYDPERMGFVSAGADAERFGTLYDTAKPGNSNQGHLFGTHLTPEEKQALLAYLKTL